MNAGQKWLQLLLDILGLEFEDGPLLTEGAHALVAHRPVLGRVLVVFVGVVVTLHLAKLIDPKYDLLASSFWKTLRQI